MPEGSIPLLIAIIALVITSAFFSSTETAYSCANRIKLRTLSTNGNKRAKRVLALAEENYDKFITTILVGNNIVNILATTLATIFFAMVITSGVDPNLISTIAMTLAVLIFGEITPKLIAKIIPEKLAMGVYPIIMFFYYLFYPLTLIFAGWKWLICKILRTKGEDIVTEDEVMTLVEEAQEDGTLKEEETELIRSVIEFDDLEVGDILVPRVNIVAVDIASSMDEIRKIFEKEGYSRIPVYKDTIDTIVGTIHEKDFFNAYLKGKKNVESILQNAFYTTEHAKISILLRQLQKKKIHIAVVLDEYGGTLGMITMEDILEELVGEIWDEHDEEVSYLKKIDDDVYLVDGNALLSDTFDYFELEGAEEFEANTVSGWAIETLGEIPPAGRSFDYKNLHVEITKSTVKRILQLKFIFEKVEDEE